jgi:hypothetical protein
MNTIDFDKYVVTEEGYFIRKTTNPEDKYERHKQRCRESNRKLYHSNDHIRLRKRTLALALRMHYGVACIRPETIILYSKHFATFKTDIAKMLDRARLREAEAALVALTVDSA